MVKVALMAPAITVTEAGVESRELVSERETLAPPRGATLLRVTVQVLEALEARVEGEQVSEESVTGALRVRVAVLETPLSVAVTVAD